MTYDSFLTAGLSLPIQALIRSGYGLFLLATLLMTLPQSRWFFVSERYGGYARSGMFTDRVQHPALLPGICALWVLCALMIAVGYQSVVFSLINLLLCRYFFIQMRWKGILRGMGAPGFLTYWLGACVFFLEYSLHTDPQGELRGAFVTLFRIDFALILLSAGLYKVVSGYPKNQGMEYGLVNPWWGYWWRRYCRLSPDHLVFKMLNHLAYLTEILAAIFLLVPWTRPLGAILVIVSFFFIATHIRLGFLCEMVMLAAFLYLDPGSWGDLRLSPWFATGVSTNEPVSGFLLEVNSVVWVLAWIYIILIPCAHAGLWYNFLAQKRLPGALQKLLEGFTNFFGVIIWRVFTVDVINFFANVYVVNPETKERKQYTRFGEFDWGSRFRYLHVGEFVCLASVFTTLKYYPSQKAMFHERLMRYARTIPCPAGFIVLFECMSIKKTSAGFEFAPAVEYRVDPQRGIDQHIIDGSLPFLYPDRVSPVREAARPGTYAPLGFA